MEDERLENRIDTLRESIIAKWRTAPQTALSLCDELERLADDTNDEEAKGFAIFYQGYSHYVLNDLKTAERFFADSRGYLTRTAQWELLAKNYNALGIIADCAGDHALAIDYFLQALVYSEEHELYRVTFSVCCNLSTVYIKLQEYSHALDCLGKCQGLISRGFVVNDYEKYAAYINVSICYANMNMYDDAERYLDRADEADRRSPVAGQRATIYFMRARLANMRGNRVLCDKYIDEIGEMKFDDVVIYDLFDEFYAYALMLLEIEKYDLFLDVIDQFEKKIEDPNSRLKLVSLKMMYYKKLGDEETYRQGAVEYYEISTVVEEDRFRSDRHNARVRVSLQEELTRREKAEKANVILKEKSELDALTGISNRYRLNEVSDKAFVRSFKSHDFAVEILDIDHYKEFNDNYGHQAGDDCLVKIAAELREMERYDGVHVGRYGGDEFMIIYEGYSKEEVSAMAQEVSDRIAALNIKHEYSPVAPHVSVSQGIFVKVPSGANKLWDFMYGADLALYDAKKNGKNGFRVITTRAEMTRLEASLPNRRN